MANIGRFLEILKCAGQVLQSYGTHPPADDAGYAAALEIHDRAFLELVMEGFPATEDGNFWVIETDGETYVLDTTRYGGTDAGGGETDGGADGDDELAEDIEEEPDAAAPAPRAVLNADGLYEAAGMADNADASASSISPAGAETNAQASAAHAEGGTSKVPDRAEAAYAGTAAAPGGMTARDTSGRAQAGPQTEPDRAEAVSAPHDAQASAGGTGNGSQALSGREQAVHGRASAYAAHKAGAGQQKGRKAPQTLQEALTASYGAAENRGASFVGEPSYADEGDAFDINMEADIPTPLDAGAGEPDASGVDEPDVPADLSQFDAGAKDTAAGESSAGFAGSTAAGAGAAGIKTEAKTETGTETRTEAGAETRTGAEAQTEAGAETQTEAAAGEAAAAPAGEPSIPTQMRMEKSGFLFCAGSVVITDPSASDARSGCRIIASPIRLENGPVPFILCVIAGKSMHTMASDGTHAVHFRSGSHRVTARMELAGTECRMRFSLDAEETARGAAVTATIRSHGRRGHMVLTDVTGNLRVHLFPASFVNNKRGTASFLYFVTNAQDPEETPATGTSNGREHVVFHMQGRDYEIRAAWKDDVLYGKVV